MFLMCPTRVGQAVLRYTGKRPNKNAQNIRNIPMFPHFCESRFPVYYDEMV